jgi:DNA-directed RNA polymerase subunit M/transcription elongation factor TFIIS
MEKKQEKVKCKKCDQGRVWLTKPQVESGTTTKGMKIITCPCCNGIWDDCMKCYIEKTYGEK